MNPQSVTPPVAPLAPPTVPLPPLKQAPAANQADADAAGAANDIIESEWVKKAKAIVAQTRNDPFEQNRAFTLLKADYMKKRYNKSIKLGD